MCDRIENLSIQINAFLSEDFKTGTRFGDTHNGVRRDPKTGIIIGVTENPEELNKSPFIIIIEGDEIYVVFSAHKYWKCPISVFKLIADEFHALSESGIFSEFNHITFLCVGDFNEVFPDSKLLLHKLTESNELDSQGDIVGVVGITYIRNEMGVLKSEEPIASSEIHYGTESLDHSGRVEEILAYLETEECDLTKTDVFTDIRMQEKFINPTIDFLKEGWSDHPWHLVKVGPLKILCAPMCWKSNNNFVADALIGGIALRKKKKINTKPLMAAFEKALLNPEHKDKIDDLPKNRFGNIVNIEEYSDIVKSYYAMQIKRIHDVTLEMFEFV